MASSPGLTSKIDIHSWKQYSVSSTIFALDFFHPSTPMDIPMLNKEVIPMKNTPFNNGIYVHTGLFVHVIVFLVSLFYFALHGKFLIDDRKNTFF